MCLLFLTDLLRNLPDVVLAAIVLVAVKGLVNVRELRRACALSRIEFWVAMVAFAGVLLLGILKGVLLAAIVSMLLLIRRAARAAACRASAAFRARGATPTAPAIPTREDVPGVADRARGRRTPLFQRRPRARRSAAARRARRARACALVVWDLSTSPYVDIAGARMLAEVARELAARGIELRIAEAHATGARPRAQGRATPRCRCRRVASRSRKPCGA